MAACNIKTEQHFKVVLIDKLEDQLQAAKDRLKHPEAEEPEDEADEEEGSSEGGATTESEEAEQGEEVQGVGEDVQSEGSDDFQPETSD